MVFRSKNKASSGPLGETNSKYSSNPILKKVELRPKNSIVSDEYVDKVFNNFYGTTLNLNELQNKIDIIKRYERGLFFS